VCPSASEANGLTYAKFLLRLEADALALKQKKHMRDKLIVIDLTF